MSIINELQIKNFMRIKVASIKPDGSLVQITGRNSQGKTSAINAIAVGLGGKRYMDAKPIREGAEKGEINIKLDNGLTIKRTITQGGGGGTLTVTDSDGMRLPAPQAVLDKMATMIGFDPLAFSRMKPADQVDQLKSIVGLDFVAIDRQIDDLTEKRRNTNRDVESMRARYRVVTFDNTAPASEVSLAELAKQQAEAAELDRAKDKLRDAADRIGDRVDESKKKMEHLTAELQKAQNNHALIQNEHVAAVEVFMAAPAGNGDAIKLQIEQADAINARVRGNNNHKILSESLQTLDATSASYTEQIDALKQEKRDKLSDAKFPIDDLEFDDAGVIYRGMPFTQASAAEQLRVSVSIAIAKAPDLKVFLIRDGSLLDTDNLLTIADMVEAVGGQVFVERVDSSGGVGVVFEDGNIVGGD